MKRYIGYIIIFIPILFVKCSDSEFSEEQMEKKAIKVAEFLDSNSIKIFYEWNYSQRGEYGFWTKLSNGNNLYACSYQNKKDTAFLTIYQPFKFTIDFPADYYFDTSRFWQFNFVEYKGRILRIESVDKNGRDNVTDILRPVERLFFKSNPFDKLASLTLLKDNLSVQGISSYNINIGNFVEFWLSSQYKLTFLPDNLKLNPKSEKFWLDEFAKGKIIKKNWNLRKVY